MSAVTNTSSSSALAQKVAPISKLWWVGLVAAAVSALGNVIFYWVSKGLGVSYMMPAEPGSTDLAPLPVVFVIIASVLPAVVATAVYAGLGRFLARPVRTFWIIAVVLLVASFAMPLTLPAAVSGGTIFSLEVMHVIAAAAIVGVLTTLGRE